MLQTETLIIEHPDNPGAPMIINKSDFDPAVHKLFEPPAEISQQPGAGEDPGAPKAEGGSVAKSKVKAEK